MEKTVEFVGSCFSAYPIYPGARLLLSPREIQIVLEVFLKRHI